MEMRAKEELNIGVDLTPPIPSLAAALYDGYLHSHCSSCFYPLSNTGNPLSSDHLFYCSPRCSNFSLSSELHLLQSLHSVPPITSSDLRTATRLLYFHASSLSDRMAGLLTNRDKFLARIEDDDGDQLSYPKIYEGAKLISLARRKSVGAEDNYDDGVLLEEAALCVVLTNAVEVQDENGRNLGIAVYDWRFSWINHSCSPNACYRFSFTTQFSDDVNSDLLRIVPHSSFSPGDVESGILAQGDHSYGPRMIVRSIKSITKGKEVTITYTDLLQPKALRQSELLSKYQFICYCTRCSSSPPAYVDHVLQEISVTNSDLRSLDYFNRDDVTKMLTDYVDVAITEYLSVGDLESCCDKLENILARGLPNDSLETEEQILQLNFRLHPLHHLSLNAYTTLSSAYKIRASDSMYSKDELVAFKMSKASAAYSLLLAGATNFLFWSESSLIAPLAYFLTSAGESLLTLARSSKFPISSLHSLEKPNCCSCSLIGTFSSGRAENTDFDTISTEFNNCITKISGKVWSFLTCDCHVLKSLKDPIDFNWLRKSSNVWDVVVHEQQLCATEVRFEMKNVIQLGVHCLLYGGYLGSICYSENSCLSSSIPNVLQMLNESVRNITSSEL